MSIESIGSKLSIRIFDEYMNIRKCMCSTRFNGDSFRVGSSLEDQPTPETTGLGDDYPLPLSMISTLESGRPDKFRKRIKERKERRDN